MKSKKNDISEITVTCKLDATFIIQDEYAKKIATYTNEKLTECFRKTMMSITGADDISINGLKVFITK